MASYLATRVPVCGVQMCRGFASPPPRRPMRGVGVAGCGMHLLLLGFLHTYHALLQKASFNSAPGILSLSRCSGLLIQNQNRRRRRPLSLSLMNGQIS